MFRQTLRVLIGKEKFSETVKCSFQSLSNIRVRKMKDRMLYRWLISLCQCWMIRWRLGQAQHWTSQRCFNRVVQVVCSVAALSQNTASKKLLKNQLTCDYHQRSTISSFLFPATASFHFWTTLRDIPHLKFTFSPTTARSGCETQLSMGLRLISIQIRLSRESLVDLRAAYQSTLLRFISRMMMSRRDMFFQKCTAVIHLEN